MTMKTVQMGDEYAGLYEGQILAKKKDQIVRVWPLPGVVVMNTSLPDDELTPAQADELARLLVKAAEDARHLHAVDGDTDGETLLDDRS